MPSLELFLKKLSAHERSEYEVMSANMSMLGFGTPNSDVSRSREIPRPQSLSGSTDDMFKANRSTDKLKVCLMSLVN